MDLLAKDPSIIEDIKTVNADVGEKLEKLHIKLQEFEKTHQRRAGLSL